MSAVSMSRVTEPSRVIRAGNKTFTAGDSSLALHAWVSEVTLSPFTFSCSLISVSLLSNNLKDNLFCKLFQVLARFVSSCWSCPLNSRSSVRCRVVCDSCLRTHLQQEFLFLVFSRTLTWKCGIVFDFSTNFR